MPDPKKMEAAVHAYVAAFEAGSADQAAALFAPDATVEDPVGTPQRRGREAIHAFRLTMASGLRCADSRVSSMRFLRDPGGEHSHGLVVVEVLVVEVAS